ncbi:MAG: carboxypeptidase-like regulatory domain-containing protein [Bacteroidales bacterium]|nr:carboxypeptidase-like regulatory domain-containing protein [Bacteroidales bacterium]
MLKIKHFNTASLLLTIVLLFSATLTFSQNYCIKGKVTDEQNRQPLAFVNIVVNDGLTGGMSDIDGKYEITCSEPIKRIKFSYLGYQTKEQEIGKNTEKLNVALTPIQYELEEVTVNAGENPAHRIIDSVMVHRAENNPNHLASYTYSIYDKMVFTIDSTSLGTMDTTSATQSDILNLFSNILNKNDLMVMETSSEVLFMAPDKSKQNVTGTKIAGVKDPTFIYLVSSMQSVSFYEEKVNIVGTNYLNPLSEGSKKRYFFNIESITPLGEGDSLYVVSFHPYKDQNFDGLTGNLYINSDGWALQSVKAEPAKAGGLFTVSIQQLYEKVEGQWFPKQFNTNLVFPSIGVSMDEKTVLPMAAIGKSYVTDIRINPDIDKKAFSELAIEVDPNAAYRNDDFWIARRIDSLNQRTLATYHFMDSITQGNNIMDVALGMVTEVAQNGYLPLGIINLDLSKIINISGYRGFYIGLGANTSKRLSRLVSLDLYGGYWTRLKEFDYGGGVTLDLYPRKQTKLSLSYVNKSDVIGAFNDMQESYRLLVQKDFKYQFFENIYARKRGGNLKFESRVGRYLKVFLTAEMVTKRYLEHYYYRDTTECIDKANYLTTELRLRYAYGEKFIGTPEGIQSLGTNYPVVWFGWIHSFKGVWDCRYSYDKFKLQVEKQFYTKKLGVSSILLQAGLATEGAPVVETFDLIGTKTKVSLYAPTSFCTMHCDEFFCDRFAALFLSHNFSGTLWHPKSSWFKPQLILITNLGWGDMHRAKGQEQGNSKTMEKEYNKIKTMEKGYYESGFIVEGIVDVGLVKLGGGVFYRYGPYSFDKVIDNFAFKWSFIIDL